MTTNTLTGTLNQGIILDVGNYTNTLTIAPSGHVVGALYGVASNIAGASLVNEGIIQATTLGVLFYGSGTVLNTGTIDGTAADIYLVAGGQITNTGLLTGGSGFGAGLTDFASFENTGTVDVTGIGVGVTRSTLSNQGSIISQQTGVELAGGLITNTGTIYGKTLGVEILSTLAAYPTQVLTGTLTNAGTIIGGEIGLTFSGGIITNTGLIAGATYALDGTGALTLNVDSTSRFTGQVKDQSNTGTLNLGGSTPGTLDLGTSFSGFSHISIAPGPTWTVEGATTDLAAGQTITGLAKGDKLILENFALTPAGTTFISGTGLELTSTAGTHITLDITGNFTTADFTLTTQSGATTIAVAEEPVCYLRGTRIATPAGEVPIETLRIGDTLITKFGGYQKIKWIGRQSFARRFVARNPDQMPVRITAGALGNNLPKADLFVSPGHSMLIGNVLVLASALINGITITQGQAPEEIHYYQIEFETHDCVLAEGAWSETYADTPDFRAKFHNAAEFEALYPNHRPPLTQTLCAARPLTGPALSAALQPILALAAPALSPGPLLGQIDSAENGILRGWAYDEANPHFPVTLHILRDGAVIGEVLACDFRADLKAAGYAHGHCGFAVPTPTHPPRAPPHQPPIGLEIRRAGHLPVATRRRANAR